MEIFKDGRLSSLGLFFYLHFWESVWILILIFKDIIRINDKKIKKQFLV